MASISKFALFDKVGYQPHAGQLPILSSKARNRVVAAGRRFGKSNLGGHELTPCAYLAYFQRNMLQDMGKRHEYWIVGPEYSDSEKEFRVLYDDLKRLKMPFDRPGTYNNPLAGDMHISLWDGAFQVHAKSAKHPETLVGEGLKGVVLAEAAKLKERVWTKFIRPTLADFNGWALMTSTPEGRNWFYKMWQQGQDPQYADWASWRSPSWANPHVFPMGATDEGIARLRQLHRDGVTLLPPLMAAAKVDPEIVSMMLDLSDEMFNQEVAALFSEFVGRVFKDFDEEVHVADLEYNPNWATYAAVDYGFTNPNVWLLIQVGPFGEINVLDEVYESGLTISEFAATITSRGLAPASTIKFFPDPALPGETRELSNLLKIKAGSGTGGELRDRLEHIRRALKITNAHLPEGHPDRKPRLMINRKCVHMIHEFNSYRYPKSAEEAAARGTNAPEAPMKKDDHTPEALGRFFAGMYGKPERRGGSRVRRANVTSG